MVEGFEKIYTEYCEKTIRRVVEDYAPLNQMMVRCRERNTSGAPYWALK